MNLFSLMLGVVAIVVGGALLGGWLLMLTVGVVHGEWLPMMPTLGYVSAVKVSVMLSLAFGIGNALSSRD